ncbi:MAG: CHAT domain-containing protein [Gammaproteobacteria bacterium]|nr:CHAT domain-containing protein [Gammaproteobacteria bacterium]
MPQTVLVLAANPYGTAKIRWEAELKIVRDALRRTDYQVIAIPQAEIGGLQAEFHTYAPCIVHFAGHGEDSGLIFNDAEGYAQTVPPAALTELFRLFRGQVECVVLNACWSDIQARAIHRHISVVAGMTQSVGDESALRFTEGFYTALGEGRDYAEAFEFGRNAMHLQGGGEHLTPMLWRRAQPSGKKRLLSLAGVTVLLALLFTIWRLWPPPAQILAGAVRDAAGEPLSGVTVALPAYGVSMATGPFGEFRLDVGAPHQAEVELLAQKNGYRIHEQYATLGNTGLSFILEKSHADEEN